MSRYTVWQDGNPVVSRSSFEEAQEWAAEHGGQIVRRDGAVLGEDGAWAYPEDGGWVSLRKITAAAFGCRLVYDDTSKHHMVFFQGVDYDPLRTWYDPNGNPGWMLDLLVEMGLVSEEAAEDVLYRFEPGGGPGDAPSYRLHRARIRAAQKAADELGSEAAACAMQLNEYHGWDRTYAINAQHGEYDSDEAQGAAMEAVRAAHAAYWKVHNEQLEAVRGLVTSQQLLAAIHMPEPAA
jgi:hypothetical protein